MITKHQATQEEKAYERLVNEAWEMLSEPARAVLREAQSVAYTDNMVRSCSLGPEEYEEAMEKMYSAVAEITDREHKLLAKLWHAALSAAASIDSEDFETITGYRVSRNNLHWYYRTLSGMVEGTLHERKAAERQREIAQQEPQDLSDIPF